MPHTALFVIENIDSRPLWVDRSPHAAGVFFAYMPELKHNSNLVADVGLLDAAINTVMAKSNEKVNQQR